MLSTKKVHVSQPHQLVNLADNPRFNQRNNHQQDLPVHRLNPQDSPVHSHPDNRQGFHRLSLVSNRQCSLHNSHPISHQQILRTLLRSLRCIHHINLRNNQQIFQQISPTCDHRCSQRRNHPPNPHSNQSCVLRVNQVDNRALNPHGNQSIGQPLNHLDSLPRNHRKNPLL